VGLTLCKGQKNGSIEKITDPLLYILLHMSINADT